MVFLIFLLLIFLLLLLYIFSELTSYFYTTFFSKAPYVPNYKKMVNEALDFLNLKSTDVLFDLGSGDGRVLLTALDKYKVKKAVGYEIDFFQVFKTRFRGFLKGYSKNKLVVYRNDFFKADYSEVTCIYLYLYPFLLKRLALEVFPKLKSVLIVSCRFAIPDLPFDSEKEVNGYKFYLYKL